MLQMLIVGDWSEFVGVFLLCVHSMYLKFVIANIVISMDHCTDNLGIGALEIFLDENIELLLLLQSKLV